MMFTTGNPFVPSEVEGRAGRAGPTCLDFARHERKAWKPRFPFALSVVEVRAPSATARGTSFTCAQDERAPFDWRNV